MLIFESLAEATKAKEATSTEEGGANDERPSFSGKVCIYTPAARTWMERFLVLEDGVLKVYKLSDLHWEQHDSSHSWNAIPARSKMSVSSDDNLSSAGHARDRDVH